MPCVSIEKETIITTPEGVREMSHRILKASTDILTINYESLEGELLPKLQEFQRENNSNSNSSTNGDMSFENELGLRLFLDVVNFCYQDPYSGREYIYTDKTGQPIRRTYGLTTAMKESGINWGDISEVSKLAPENWAKTIQLDKNDGFYLGEERGKRIKGFATQLLDRGFYNVSEYIYFYQHDSAKILSDFAQNGFFNDDFLKRAQLAVRDLDTTLKKRFNEQLFGTEKLTVMADYRLPQLMYNFGTIILSNSLREKLENKKIIMSGSREELALRAATITVGEELSKLMNITEADVDLLLWMLAVKMGKSNELFIPHMLVPTDKY